MITAGFGYGVVNTTGILAAGHYFDKYRALANACCVSGTGAGILIMGQLFPFLLNKFSWQVVFKILAGISLLCFPMVATYKPLKPKKVKLTERLVTFNDSESDSSEITIEITRSKIPNVSDVVFGPLSNSRSADHMSYTSRTMRK